MVDLAKLGKHSIETLIFLRKNEPIVFADLSEIISGPQTYRRIVDKLVEAGYVTKKERIKGRREIEISLTSTGRMLADSLDNLNKDTYEIPENFGENFRNMSAMVHFNVKDDHVAVTEHNFDGSGNERIVYIYTRPNGHNILRLWCDVDKSFDCKHTQFAWTLPDVQEMVEIKFKDLKK